MEAKRSRVGPRAIAGNPLYTIPKVAWPTLGLLCVGSGMWLVNGYMAVTNQIAAPWSVLLITLAVYLLFTVIHEAVHQSIFRLAWLNTLVGHIITVVLGPTTSFTAYRYLHLQHHRYTNDRAHDPDFWSGRGTSWRLLFCWLTTDLYYYYFYLFCTTSRHIRERVEIFLVSGLLLGTYIVSWPLGWGLPATLFWVLPGRLVITFLAWTFNFLPHRPYQVRGDEAPYHATSVLLGAERWLTPLLMYHNFHLIHHVFPGVPFYRYRKIWEEREREFRQVGSPIIELFRRAK